MKVFDIANMQSYGYDGRSQNVFYEKPEFKMRVIALPTGGSIPKCEMASYVVFMCVEGEALVTINGEEVSLIPGRGLVTEPTTVSMRSDVGAKLLGIQIVSTVRT